MNFTITLNGEGPELANALRVLKEAIDGQAILTGEVSATIAQTQSTQQDSTAYQQPPVYQQQFEQQQMPVQQQQPVYQQPVYPPQQNQQAHQQQFDPNQQAQQGVPVSTTTYSMDQLSVAATQLMDAGRRNDLLALLAQFGVPALTMLPKEHYGAFATQLRTLGAKI